LCKYPKNPFFFSLQKKCRRFTTEITEEAQRTQRKKEKGYWTCPELVDKKLSHKETQ
jgi:hypothetical protein